MVKTQKVWLTTVRFPDGTIIKAIGNTPEASEHACTVAIENQCTTKSKRYRDDSDWDTERFEVCDDCHPIYNTHPI